MGLYSRQGPFAHEKFAILAAQLLKWHMTEHDRRHSDRLVQLSASAAPKPEIESRFYELRKGKVWFSEEIKREQRKLKTSLWR